MSARVTRSRSRQASQEPASTGESRPQASTVLVLKAGLSDHRISLLPLDHKFKGLSKAERDVLAFKQRKLHDHEFQSMLRSSECAQAAAATVVFAQEEAGTAICVSPHGLLLTCAHCIADGDERGTGVGQTRWLLFASGRAVHARCVAWDPRRDLALLEISSATCLASTEHVGLNADQSGQQSTTFSFIPIAPFPPKPNTPLLCVGHPGSEDLEASVSGIATDYAVLHTSTGRFRGLAKGQDPQDNSEIGALRHDCWTYWGHSGAPLVSRKEGMLVGLHSSWDEETGMRRGVPLEAVRAFLGEWVERLE